MNVTVENVAACRKKVNIEIPADEVAREWKGAIAEVRKFAPIPGFRIGHAPIQVLEKRFSKEIRDEVQRKLIPQSYREAIAKEKLKVLGAPHVGEVKLDHGQPLRFDFTVDVAPEFALPTYKGLKVKKKKVEVKDEDIDSALNLLAEQQASFDEIKDRTLNLGDYAVVSYTGVCEGKPIVEIAPSARPLSENNQFWLLMGKDSFLPGFCDPLVGAKIGEKKQVLVDFPKDFRVTELASKKATYFVEVHGIREKKLPKLDDTFAVSYKAKDLAELKGRVRDNMTREREHQSEHGVRDQIVSQLLKATTFDLPESVVNAETQNTMLDIIRENQGRGMSEDALRGKSKEIFDFAQQSARDKVRASFILSRIAIEEKVEVKEDEVLAEITRAAEQARKPVAEIRRRIEETGEIDNLRQQMAITRTLDLLVTNAIVEPE